VTLIDIIKNTGAKASESCPRALPVLREDIF